MGKISNIEILKTEVLSHMKYLLQKVTYSYSKHDGSKQVQVREVYDRGNGAVILLYNRQQRSVILTRQFRLPTFMNGNPTGMLIEACAGQLDGDDPLGCIIRETEEETGYKISNAEKVFEVYMSPGSVSEILYFFVAEYHAKMKVSEGGGAPGEEENIEVLEFGIDEAMAMINTGAIKDAKTIMLLQYVRLHGLL